TTTAYYHSSSFHDDGGVIVFISMFIVGVYFKKCRVSSLIFSCIQGSQIVGGYHNIVTSSTNSPDFGSCFLIDIGWNGTTYNVHVSEVIVSTFKFIKSHCHYNLLVAFI